MNTAFGEPHDLPFDLRNRRFPLTFHLDERRRRLDEKVEELAAQFVNAIGMCQQTFNERVTRVVSQLDIHSIELIRGHGKSKAFYTEDAPENALPLFSSQRLAIPRLLELGVIHSFRIEAENRYVYGWTRLGRECARYLGVSIPERDTSTNDDGEYRVLTDLRAIEDINGSSKANEQSVFYRDRVSDSSSGS